MASFKTDESFLEKISIGVIGTQKVFEHLTFLGHKPIELERGSMNYKIWKKIKIKRERVPDILCVDNGIRVESRAKTKLEITMSHSKNDPKRGWDYGMKDEDYVAIVVCEKSGDRPIDWKADSLVQYISVGNLRKVERENKVLFVQAKGSQEGFESRITWPSTIASSDGIITDINAKSIQYQTELGRKITLRLNKGNVDLIPLVNVGEKVTKNQFLASSVLTESMIPAGKVDSFFFLKNLQSIVLSERYAAAKALSFFNEKEVIDSLKKVLLNKDEHIYVKLEASASLARFGEDDGYNFILTSLKDNYLANVLETVIVLAEIKSDRACKILSDILIDENYDAEIRAGAAWGLGEQQNKSALDAIVNSFNSFDMSIRIEAARSLGKLSNMFGNDILSKFNAASINERPGVAWALSKNNTLKLDDLLSSLNDLDSRHWISYIIGTNGEERFISEIEKLKNIDSEVYFAVTLLWKLMSSWVYELKEY